MAQQNYRLYIYFQDEYNLSKFPRQCGVNKDIRYCKKVISIHSVSYDHMSYIGLWPVA